MPGLTLGGLVVAGGCPPPFSGGAGCGANGCSLSRRRSGGFTAGAAGPPPPVPVAGPCSRR